MLTKICQDFFIRYLDQVNAVHRTRIPAKVAACAVSGDDRMHQLMSANDGIDRAGSNAQCAADAFLFPDDRKHGAGELPVFIIEGEWFASQ